MQTPSQQPAPLVDAHLEDLQNVAIVDDKIAGHEEAAHEKRNWVRLTFDCNNHCVFCLDTLAHDGNMRDREDVKKQILEGRKAGATRLILSGGEPTMHPHYVDFIKLGRLAGYRKIQTVTNGRRFQYPEFLKQCLDAGLNEITFSLHGPNAKIHDALVGVKGAFEQETAGLRGALADGRPVVNVDIVINRGNVKHLPDMLEKFYGMGVKEFDLLQVIPFGNAFREGKDILFYDLEEMRPYLLKAFAWSKRPDVHIWLNRFPPPHLEGFEHLIQDPYKLNDEVKGRKEEYARLLEEDIDLDCREPDRCKHCYLERLCDTLYDVKARIGAKRFDVVRFDTEWERNQEKVFGGDPASSRKQRPRPTGGLLPLLGEAKPRVTWSSMEELVADSGAQRVALLAPDVTRAREALARFPGVTKVELELGSWAGLAEALDGDTLDGRTLTKVTVATSDAAIKLLALPATFEVMVNLSRQTAPWLLAMTEPPPRLALRQPYYERLTESAERDVDLPEFFALFRHPVPVEGVPACVLGRAPRPLPAMLDTAMLTEAGKLEIFRYAKRFIVEHYLTKSLRCKACAHKDTCQGMHVNYVRAHGYGLMQPVDPEGKRVAPAADSELPMGQVG
jgi:MoaA/NifB/PqqE/SkfB family radical SAM enzyme